MRYGSTEENDLYFNLKKTIKFYEFKLPFSQIFEGTECNIISGFFSKLHICIALIYFLFYYNNILKQEQITQIHLNSLVLWPLLLVLPKSMKRVIHIREIPTNSLVSKVAIFIIKRYATTIISIDPITHIPFTDSCKSVIIPNPINMTRSRQLRPLKKSIKSELGIPSNTFIISIFGLIGEQKGFEFFMKIVASSIHIPNLIFLIIGNPYGEYGEKCIESFKKYNNVKYLGEQRDTTKFYAITDLVIRCENYLPLGRTVWEAIYAGGIALVPVNKNDNISVIQELVDKYIYVYDALNQYSCIEKINKILKKYPDTVIDSGYPISDNITGSAELFFDVITNN